MILLRMRVNIMSRLLPAMLLAAILVSCDKARVRSGTLYSCNEYAVFPDSVTEEDYSARAISANAIESNYLCNQPDVQRGSNIRFRLAINHRDNELAQGLYHVADIYNPDSGHKFQFGTVDNDSSYIISSEQNDTSAIPTNHPWTVRVDMRPMLRDFSDKGFYVTPTGDTIYADSYNGLWISGDIPPLDSDFSGHNRKRALKLFDRGDSIYELAVKLNPSSQAGAAAWKCDSLPADFPTFISDDLLTSALYNMEVDHLVKALKEEPSGGYHTTVTSAALAVYMGLAYTNPDISKKLLRKYIRNGRIEDSYSGDTRCWPLTGGRLAWIMAAYEVYKVTADTAWIDEIHDVAVRTFEIDMSVVRNRSNSLMQGAMDYYHMSTDPYPVWMTTAEVFMTGSLTNNIYAYAAAQVLEKIASARGDISDSKHYRELKNNLKSAINSRLWIPNRGFYSEYVYGSPYYIQSQSTDNLGQSLAVLFDVANPEMSEILLKRTPRSVFGVPAIYPSNNSDAEIMPFIQALWSMACAKYSSGTALSNSIGALYRLCAFAATPYARSRFSDGKVFSSRGKTIADCCANTALIFKVYAGMDFTESGIVFRPVIPNTITGEKKIRNFRYRNAILDIVVSGTGNRIAGFYIDGRSEGAPYLVSDTLTGNHEVKIVMANNSLESEMIAFTSQSVLPSIPQVEWYSPRKAKITNFKAGQCFLIVINGTIQEEMSRDDYSLYNTHNYTMVDFLPVSDNRYVGFSCRPYEYIPKSVCTLLPASDFGKTGTYLIKNDSSEKHYIELSPARNVNMVVSLIVADEAEYVMDLYYSNGAGIHDAQDKCAIRSLAVNGITAGAFIMPQMGSDDWRSFGWSNRIKIRLNKGANRLELKYLSEDMNSNIKINTALLKQIRLIRLEQ